MTPGHIALVIDSSGCITCGCSGDGWLGFASSTIDTAEGGITVRDYLVADLPIAARLHRATARTSVHLTRALRVSDFEIDVDLLRRFDANVIGPLHGQGSVRLVCRIGRPFPLAARSRLNQDRMPGIE